LKIREINRQQIEEVRNLNRREIVEQVYYYKKDLLVLKDEYHDIRDWNPDELEQNIKDLYDLHDRGGIFYGAFLDHKLIGIIALESNFIGSNKNQLQVLFLHIDAKHRDKGLGTKLMSLVKKRAKRMGARRLYISATPSKHTIDFYLGLGCKLASEINPKLYELEPEDIHLELII
jgi:predicted N-acetyltransferase YhbS